jgi:PHD/YefM family antitoxin component YafN of YafNO toxin-antitoxin module
VQISKKYIVDEHGNPKEVIIPVEDFENMQELLGWDTEEEALDQVREARRDRERKNKDAYDDVDSI